MSPFASDPKTVRFGVPQGSAVSPMFNIYMTSLVVLGESFGIQVVSYADDTQIVLTWDKNTPMFRIILWLVSAVF